jgi:hypothetical protein
MELSMRRQGKRGACEPSFGNFSAMQKFRAMHHAGVHDVVTDIKKLACGEFFQLLLLLQLQLQPAM